MGREYKKEYNITRKRPFTIGIKLSKEEKAQLEKACKKLELSKLEFILKAIGEVLGNE